MMMQRSPEIDEVGLTREQALPARPFTGRLPLLESAAKGRARVRLVRSIAEYRIRQVIWLLVAVVDTVASLDFLFRLVGASNTGVAHLIFISGSWLAGPFDGIFASVPRIPGLTLRWSDLLVLVLASIAGWGLVRLAGLSGSGRRQRIVERAVA